MNWKLLLVLFCAMGMLVPFAGCTSDDDDDPVVVVVNFGPSAIAVGITTGGSSIIMTSNDFLNWNEQTGSGITVGIEKVVVVPNSSPQRLVAVVDGATGEYDQIWYNDNGGSGAWTQAWYGTSLADESYLDPEHQSTGTTYDDWDIQDMVFLNSTTGYAIGNDDYLLLWTYDAGATWHDLNVYQPSGAATITYQELDINPTTWPADFVPGATITGDVVGSGTIISVNVYDEEIIVELTTPGTSVFANGENVTVTSTEAITSVPTDILWKYNFRGAYSTSPRPLFGIEDSTGAHTLWLGQSAGYNISGTAGIWMITTDAPATPAARVVTVVGPQPDQQYGTGEIGTEYINSIFFFDANTGAAATDDGIWICANGTDWTMVGSSLDRYEGLAYSQPNLTQSGFLISINQTTTYNEPVRLAVTYTAGTPGTWAFDATPALEVHGTAANVDMWYIDSPSEIFQANGKMFVFESGDGYGYWGWGNNPNATNFNDSRWTDNTEDYEGGTSTNPANAGYQKGVLEGTSAPSGYINWIAKR